MTRVLKLFPTKMLEGKLPAPQIKKLHPQFMQQLEELEAFDRAGQAWSKKNYRGGYTSYGSLDNLHWRHPAFSDLEKLMSKQVQKYARSLNWDLRGQKLVMTTCWISRMGTDTTHSNHIHPHSVISGTYYVKAPVGVSSLKVEDPRLDRFMASPPKKEKAPLNERPFIYLPAKEGQFYLFESWMRHEVPPNPVKGDRISISFNYGLEN